MPAAAADGRQSRRRQETRRKLLDGASALFARQGVDRTRITEITDEADVGFGSFYNHFDSKEAVVAAVLEEQTRAIGEGIRVATESLEDPAEVVAVAHRTVIARAVADPEFGSLLVRLEVSHDLVSAALGPHAARDIERGLREERFTAENPTVALAATGGALLGVVRASLGGHLDESAAIEHAAGVLRLLGLPAKQAKTVARRPLPDPLGRE